jgi:hypothetical protein
MRHIETPKSTSPIGYLVKLSLVSPDWAKAILNIQINRDSQLEMFDLFSA